MRLLPPCIGDRADNQHKHSERKEWLAARGCDAVMRSLKFQLLLKTLQVEQQILCRLISLLSLFA